MRARRFVVVPSVALAAVLATVGAAPAQSGGTTTTSGKAPRTTATTTDSTTATTRAKAGTTTSTGSESSTTSTSIPPGIDPVQRSQFARIASRILEEYEIPGAVVGVFTPEGEWVLTRGFANVNAKRGIRRSDRFGIRSVSKSFTVTALLRLVDRGDVGLDDPISDYVEGVPGGEAISLRQLAAMTSGLPDYIDSPEVRAALGEDPTREWTDRELVDAAFALPPEFAPGTEYSYTNTNTILLGMVVEAVTEKPFADALRSLVLRPLGLNDTSYAPGRPIPDPHALSYDVDPDTGEATRVDVDTSAFSTAGGIVSTLDDLRVWVESLATGGLVEKSTQWQRLAASRVATDGPVYDRYGLGIGEIDGWWGHTGQGLGYQAAAFHDPVDDATIVVLVNAAPSVNVPELVFAALARQLGRA